MEIITFDPESIENLLARMEPSEIDALAFGAIMLDAKGTILAYNQAEGQITGRNPIDMIGKNFFMDIAPCTRTPEFHGRFEAGVNAGKFSNLLEYSFDYQMAPTTVKVYMKSDLIRENVYWVFVKRL